MKLMEVEINDPVGLRDVARSAVRDADSHCGRVAQFDSDRTR